MRKNIGGKLYSLNYGKAISVALDPIEKKPFYHFMPGSRSLSFATVGCNFRCPNCQNWNISQQRDNIAGQDYPPEKIVAFALQEGAEGIAYTYTEPTIFMEYALDTAKLARPKGLYNVFVTNGYMSKYAIEKMKPLIDASRIDLKGFSDRIYSEMAGGAKLECVLASIKSLHKIMHIEIINLVIPGMNDSRDELLALSQWVRDLDQNIPLHFTGFYPAYKMLNVPPTPLQTLRLARETALDCGLRYVYTGNRADPSGESSYCYNCGAMLIKRFGFSVLENRLRECKCPKCGKRQNFVCELKKQRKAGR